MGQSNIVSPFVWSGAYLSSFFAGIASLILFLFGYILGRRKKKNLIFSASKLTGYTSLQWRPNKWGLFLGVCIGGVAAFFLLSQHIFQLIWGGNDVSRSGNSSTLFTYLSLFFLSIISVACAVMRDLDKLNKTLIFGILLPVLCILGFLSGSKTIALAPISLVIFHYSIQHNGISFKALFAFLFFVLVFIPIGDIWRSSGQIGFNLGLEAIMSILSRSYGTDVLHQVIEHHLGVGNYLWGASFAVLVVAWIPRVLWENKPIISFGYYVSENYLPHAFTVNEISAPPTLIGELFANFSFLSFLLLPIVAVFLGALVRRCLDRCSGSRVPLIWLSLSFPSLIFIQETSLSGFIFYGLLNLVVSWFANILFLRRVR